MQRRKGANWEVELSHILSNEFGHCYKRNLGQARDSGCDIHVGKFLVEAKRYAKIAVYKWYKQVSAAASEPIRQIPIVIMRADNEEALVLLSLHDFLPLMRGELGKAA
jgi:hypothetical protein